MESLDFKRLTSWDKTVWGVKEINRTCLTESVDSAASTDGAERTCESKSICRGAAKG